MKISQYELSAYLVIIMMTILLASIGVLNSPSPNLSVPLNPELPQPTGTSTSTPTVDVPPPQQSNEPTVNFLNIIFYLLLIVLIFIILRGLLNLRMNYMKRRQIVHFDSNNVRRNLEDARTEAFKIITRGLENQNYKSAFIDAYIALDLGLEDFRDLKRPKHFTPLEYSYSVKPPVFKPSVFKFVSKFYELRYGDRDADRNNLLEFRTQLQYLFIEEVPPEIFAVWQKDYASQEGAHLKFVIPRVFEPTQPGGRN